jgi:hypothetical protein
MVMEEKTMYNRQERLACILELCITREKAVKLVNTVAAECMNFQQTMAYLYFFSLRFFFGRFFFFLAGQFLGWDWSL